ALHLPDLPIQLVVVVRDLANLRLDPDHLPARRRDADTTDHAVRHGEDRRAARGEDVHALVTPAAAIPRRAVATTDRLHAHAGNGEDQRPLAATGGSGVHDRDAVQPLVAGRRLDADDVLAAAHHARFQLVRAQI